VSILSLPSTPRQPLSSFPRLHGRRTHHRQEDDTSSRVHARVFDAAALGCATLRCAYTGASIRRTLAADGQGSYEDSGTSILPHRKCHQHVQRLHWRRGALGFSAHPTLSTSTKTGVVWASTVCRCGGKVFDDRANGLHVRCTRTLSVASSRYGTEVPGALGARYGALSMLCLNRGGRVVASLTGSSATAGHQP